MSDSPSAREVTLQTPSGEQVVVRLAISDSGDPRVPSPYPQRPGDGLALLAIDGQSILEINWEVALLATSNVEVSPPRPK
ncbi:hypothetical protein [Lysobacter sp. A3-1-A15]|uniref:hypothetical protein n=1 Tax=Novilysobacter viscosus TaxID=3098602 RepID=UPI002ED7A0CD